MFSLHIHKWARTGIYQFWGSVPRNFIKDEIIGFYPTNQNTLYLLHLFYSDTEIIIVHGRPAICTLIGWIETSRLFLSFNKVSWMFTWLSDQLIWMHFVSSVSMSSSTVTLSAGTPAPNQSHSPALKLIPKRDKHDTLPTLIKQMS